MDTLGASSNPIPLIPAVVFLLFSFVSLVGAQTSSTSIIARAKKLSDEQQWQEVVSLVQSTPNPSAELDFY
jgi:hypothetical protein